MENNPESKPIAATSITCALCYDSECGFAIRFVNDEIKASYFCSTPVLASFMGFYDIWIFFWLFYDLRILKFLQIKNCFSTAIL